MRTRSSTPDLGSWPTPPARDDVYHGRVSPVSLAFFTVDHGTASTSAALVAPLDGHFRLLASGVAPAGTELDALLEDLVARVEAVEPGLLVDALGWQDWARLESATRPAHRVLLLGPSNDPVDDLGRVFVGGGWEVAGRVSAERLDPLGAVAACLDPALSAIAIASPGPEQVGGLQDRLGPLIGSIIAARPGLPVLLCGPTAGWSGLPLESLIHLPRADQTWEPAGSALRDALARLDLPPPHERWEASVPGPSQARDLPDGRQTVGLALQTLADLLDRRIEAVDVGHSGGTRTLADNSGILGHLVSAEGAMVPSDALDGPSRADEIARWSAIRSDPFSVSDRLRNLRLWPWRDLGGDGGRLRLAALRAALARLDGHWRERQPSGGVPVADMLICAGGGFAAVPPPAATMAVVDGMRRAGALTVFHDHARLLGPIGALPDPGDRRRLLVDLLDDALLPLGSALVTGEIRTGPRAVAMLRVTSRLQEHDLELAPNTVRLVDLPPGVTARVDLEVPDGQALGVRAHRISLDVTGGLGGLLVDTRDVALRLPERAERRRALLESWERPVWGAEA